jgi:hypothetical protein
MAPDTAACPSCSSVDIDCWHDPKALPLARALAAKFQGVDEPTDEQVASFVDDAESLIRDVGEGPYTVQRFTALGRYNFVFTVNGVLCGVQEGEGQIEAEPIAKDISW